MVFVSPLGDMVGPVQRQRRPDVEDLPLRLDPVRELRGLQVVPASADRGGAILARGQASGRVTGRPHGSHGHLSSGHDQGQARLPGEVITIPWFLQYYSIVHHSVIPVVL